MSNSIGGVSQNVAQALGPNAAGSVKNTKATEEANESAAERKAEGDKVSISSAAMKAASEASGAVEAGE